MLEEFVVASWDDYLRQHERVTKREQAHLERVRELTDPDQPREHVTDEQYTAAAVAAQAS